MHETVGRTRLRIKIGKIGMLGALYREKKNWHAGGTFGRGGRQNARETKSWTAFKKRTKLACSQTPFGRDRQNVHPTIARVDF